MHSLTCMAVVVCVVRKLRPCNSYSRRRDCINSVLWRSYYKGGAGYPAGAAAGWRVVARHPERLDWGLGRSLAPQPGPGARRAQREGLPRALGVHRMAWPADVQCRWERHCASPQASPEPEDWPPNPNPNPTPPNPPPYPPGCPPPPSETGSSPSPGQPTLE